MHVSFKALAIGLSGAVLALGALSANAQSDGADYHPLQMQNSNSNPQASADAIAASHASGTEAIGQSTSAPMVSSPGISREAVYREAVATAHGTSSEVVGQSTGMAGITGGVAH